MRSAVAPLMAAALAATLPAPAAAATFAAPVQPAVIEEGCDYGDTECLDPNSRHAGVDYLADEPDEPILAAADGVVRIVADAGSDASHDFGHVVVLEHTLPGGGHVSTVYAHLRSRPTVRPGDCVPRGARLGFMGQTGTAANVHLHFEVKEDPKVGPPYGYTAGDPDDEGYFDPKLFVGRREAADLCAPEVEPIDPDPVVTPEPATDCDGARASRPAIARGAREMRASGRVRALPAGCRIRVSLLRRRGASCAHWRQSRRRMERRSCDAPMWTTVAAARDGTLARWNHRFAGRLIAGDYELRLRVVDRRGRVEAPAGYPAVAFSLG